MTSSGVSTTPAPLLTAPPISLQNIQLLNLNLTPGDTWTFALLLLDGSTTVGLDYISAVVPGAGAAASVDPVEIGEAVQSQVLEMISED